MKWEDHPDVLVFSREMSTGGRCQHMAVAVDESSRRVWCQTCDTELDPIEVIARYATDHFRLRDKMNASRPEHWEKIEEFIGVGGTLSLADNKVVASMKVGGKKKTIRGIGLSLAARVVNAVSVWQWRLPGTGR